jgi:hypothetical protein
MKFALEIVAFAVVACRVINGTEVEDIAWTYYKVGKPQRLFINSFFLFNSFCSLRTEKNTAVT